MNKTLLITLVFGLLLITGCQTKKDIQTNEPAQVEELPTNPVTPGIYEVRTYYAPQGKLEALLARFRDHTVKLFEKHGMMNIGYWTPIENQDNTLTYILGFPDRKARDASFAAFRKDPDWVATKEASQVNGPLVDSVKNTFLKVTAFSPDLTIINAGPRVFEMRTYYTNQGKLGDLHTRFRDATIALFEKHGITNIAYFDLDNDQEGADNTLFYIITHADREVAKENWQAFIDDPEWKSVYEASIADGNLVDSITSTFMVPVDFSPLK